MEPEKPSYEYTTDGGVCYPVKSGSIVVFDGLTLHWSFHNTSEKSREAYIMHFAESDNVEWG
jgi:ectoine hydroxylase-related dioxygenase (phytanoyl-CoA dioxygenase family)